MEKVENWEMGGRHGKGGHPREGEGAETGTHMEWRDHGRGGNGVGGAQPSREGKETGMT